MSDTKKHANRTTFKPGVSGNPTGRPKMDPEIKEALGRLTPKAMKLLEKFIGDDDCPPNVRLSAAIQVLDRRFGKPVQATEISGPDGGDIPMPNQEQARAKVFAAVVDALKDITKAK